jgi:hypothetical protein
MEIEMFSRNEKYGQALHLPYGFETAKVSKKSTTKNTWLMKLVSFFSAASETEAFAGYYSKLEMKLDKDFLASAISSELKNRDAAANENRMPAPYNKIA